MKGTQGPIRPRPHRVLLVEDTADLREMWLVWLLSLGFEVDEARDGAEAVRKALAYRPDVVLMDMWLPHIDGLEATRQIRQLPGLADVPIIAVSAQDGTQIAGRALASGCTRFVQKPVSPDELLLHLRAVLPPVAPVE